MDVMFIRREDDGGIYWSDWRWPDGSFTELDGQLGAVVCPVVSAKCLIETKEGYLQENPDDTDREKCLRDIASLRSLLRE